MTAGTEKAAKSEEYRDKDDNKCKNTAKFENIPKTDDSAGTKKDCFYWKTRRTAGFSAFLCIHYSYFFRFRFLSAYQINICVLQTKLQRLGMASHQNIHMAVSGSPVLHCVHRSIDHQLCSEGNAAHGDGSSRCGGGSAGSSAASP